jgi:hypothetical protein
MPGVLPEVIYKSGKGENTLEAKISALGKSANWPSEV